MPNDYTASLTKGQGKVEEMAALRLPLGAWKIYQPLLIPAKIAVSSLIATCTITEAVVLLLKSLELILVLLAATRRLISAGPSDRILLVRTV